VGAPKNELGSPQNGYAHQHLNSIAPGSKSRLKGNTRKRTCTAAVPDDETLADI